MTPDNPQPLLGRLAASVSAPGKIVLIASAVLLILGAISAAFSRGELVQVVTNAPDAQVAIDGRTGEKIDATTVRFTRVPLGKRQAVAGHRDYITKASALDVGVFGDGRFQIDLERRKVHLTVNTAPGAEIVLDGQTLGKANQSGVFYSDQVLAGDYAASVRLTGYEQWNAGVEIHDDAESFQVSLQMTPEGRAGAARQRDRADELLQEATNLFGRRNYKAALEAINESRRLYPDDYRAQQLRERIMETIKILQ